MGKKSKRGSTRRTSTKKKTNNPSNKEKRTIPTTNKKRVEEEDKENELQAPTTSNNGINTEITAEDMKALEYARKRAEIERRVAEDLAKRKEEEDKLAAASITISTSKDEDKSVTERADETIQAFKSFKEKEEKKAAEKVEEKIQRLAQENLEQIQKSAMNNVRNNVLIEEVQDENTYKTDDKKDETLEIKSKSNDESKEIITTEKKVAEPQSIENQVVEKPKENQVVNPAEDLVIEKNTSTETVEMVAKPENNLVCGCVMTCEDESYLDTKEMPEKIEDKKIKEIEDIPTLKELPKDMSAPESPEAEKQDCACVIS